MYARMYVCMYVCACVFLSLSPWTEVTLPAQLPHWASVQSLQPELANPTEQIICLGIQPAQCPPALVAAPAPDGEALSCHSHRCPAVTLPSQLATALFPCPNAHCSYFSYTSVAFAERLGLCFYLSPDTGL
jgi:hypothetical protein